MKKGHTNQKTNKVALLALVIIFGLSLAALIYSITLKDWMKIGLATAALILYAVPILITKAAKIQLPSVLEVTYYLFVFAALILGEVFAFYGPFPFWDIVLHSLSGFVLAGIGFSLIEMMNRGHGTKFIMLVFAFCFSVTIGILWECLEFSFDMTVRTDAQKDAHLSQISTITMQRDGGNRPVKVDNITTTDIHLANGDIVTIDEGYLDIGLIDTMKDIFVNIAGALAFCLVGIVSIKQGRKGFAGNFIPTTRD
ncbi:MAG: hypothetical protein Q4F61_00690 [Candidatus Saccharibacteria bacterium]|nr:hypothetical protein [Candidatus Saccharibacteria bacterium]